MADESMPNQSSHGRGGPPPSGERRQHPRRSDVTHDDLAALRSELLVVIEDGDKRTVSTVLTALKSELATYFQAMNVRFDGLSEQVSEHNKYVQTAKAEDAEEERLRHEAEMEAQWLAKQKALAEKPKQERREKIVKVMPLLYASVAGMATGAFMSLYSQLGTGVRWNAQTDVAIVLFVAVALVILVIWRVN